MVEPDFRYSNLPLRPPGRLVRAASLFLPGVREVQAQVVPFARTWGEANRAALTATGPLWVALGDSMTQGIGADSVDQGWVPQLSARWAHPYRILNLSSSGATVADVLERQLPALSGLAGPADLVTVLIGSNDLMGRDRAGMPGRFADLLRRLPRGAVVANLPNPTRTARAVNELIGRAAAAGEVVVADLIATRPPSWRGRLAADHFHPNGRGYTTLADAFAAAIGHRPPVRGTPACESPA